MGTAASDVASHTTFGSSRGPGTGAAPPARILVVDDEPMNRSLLEAILTADGHTVLHAENGQAALDVLAAEPVDLVILDVLMPVMNGLETCRRIRGELGRLTLPIVFATALHDRESRIAGKE